MSAPRTIPGDEDGRGQHGQAVPRDEDDSLAVVSLLAQREPGKDAGRQEQIVEALIEREAPGRMRLRLSAAEAAIHSRPRPPQALHAEEQYVDDPGQRR